MDFEIQDLTHAVYEFFMLNLKDQNLRLQRYFEDLFNNKLGFWKGVLTGLRYIIA